MVTRAWGQANGYQIEFKNIDGDRWRASVPVSENGEYIVEIFAEDEAGNVGYLATMLFEVFGHELHGYIVPAGYKGGMDRKQYSGLATVEQFLSEIGRENKTDGDKLIFAGTLKEGGYTSERIICGRDGN